MSTEKLPAITLHQPWATLIVTGKKLIETRTWSPKLRGTIAIHAAQEIPSYAFLAVSNDRHFAESLEAAGYDPTLQDLPLGAVLGTADIAHAGEITSLANFPDGGHEISLRSGPTVSLSPWEFAFGNFTPGRHAWILENVRPFPEPIPARGRQGLWTWEPPAE